ncbi:MAG: EAL domain-containing protein [Steroidobacteraceae bacterium]
MNQPGAKRHRVLCVDDEPRVLEGLSLHLRRQYEVMTATSGAAALALLEERGGADVIIADMRMPGMDGASFLARVNQAWPDSRRILLTGETDLQAAADAVNEGRLFRFLLKPCPPPIILGAVRAAIDHRQAEMADRSAIRRGAEERVAGRDELTGLLNRERLLRAMAGQGALAGSGGTKHILFIDIDHFRDFDEIGESGVGDWVLRILAQRLKDYCTDAQWLARWGEDQFVVVMPAEAEGAVLQLWAKGLLGVLTEPMLLDDGVQNVALNVGVSRWPDDDSEPRGVVRCAELAARESRRGGRQEVVFFKREWRQRADQQRELRAALREAIEQEQLQLFYQPIIDVNAGRVRALEGLARWEHARLGAISPGVFIPIAEESGLIVPLGRTLLRCARRDARQLTGPLCERIAVNVSVHQLVRSNFLLELDRAIAEFDVSPSRLELEVTESVFAGDIESVQVVLARIRRRGIRVAIDDFGTGYSSLSYLSQFPADQLKVDASFVRAFDSGGRAIISAALDIARDVRMEVVIEGVENVRELEQVRGLGATLVQGFHFAKPMPVAQVQEWLRRFHAGESAGESGDLQVSA